MDIERTTRTEVVLTEIGERMRRLRIDQGMTQAELAERAGIGLRTLQRLENGTAATQLSSVVKISQALGLEKRLDALIPKPEISPIALLQLKTGVRKRASGKKPSKAAGSWKWVLDEVLTAVQRWPEFAGEAKVPEEAVERIGRTHHLGFRA